MLEALVLGALVMGAYFAKKTWQKAICWALLVVFIGVEIVLWAIGWVEIHHLLIPGLTVLVLLIIGEIVGKDEE